MKRMISIFISVFLLLSLFTGCTQQNSQGSSGTGTTLPLGGGVGDPIEVDFAKTDADMFTERDFLADYDPDDAVIVQLNGDTATASSDSVKINGSTVILTGEKTHIISGTLDDGMIVVDAEKSAKLQLVFNGVHITSKTSAALYIRQANKVFVTLAEGTENSLTNGGSFVPVDNENIDGALFSKRDLTLNGSGKLTVTSPAGHGIVCKDDLVITGGTYVIHSAAHGLDANDSIRIADSSVTVDAGKDAVHAENSEDTTLGFLYISGSIITAEAEGDGLSAGAHMQIAGGILELLTGGGNQNGTKEQSDFFGGFMGGPGQKPPANSQDQEETGTSMKGLKAAGGILISGGILTVDAADDAVHSDTSVVINGGTLQLASGDDAVHAEESLAITAGMVHVSTSYEGLEAMHIAISGGDVRLVASDDGINAAGGVDQSGTQGGRDHLFGDRKPGNGGRPGGPGDSSANSNGSVTVSGGTVYIQASGDGIDANGMLEISGGFTMVTGPTRGDTSMLDYDKDAVFSGGTFLATGAIGMTNAITGSGQGVIFVNTGNQTAGTVITLAQANGDVLFSWIPELDFTAVILSSPDLAKGEEYQLTIGSKSIEVSAK